MKNTIVATNWNVKQKKKVALNCAQETQGHFGPEQKPLVFNSLFFPIWEENFPVSLRKKHLNLIIIFPLPLS